MLHCHLFAEVSDDVGATLERLRRQHQLQTSCNSEASRRVDRVVILSHILDSCHSGIAQLQSKTCYHASRNILSPRYHFRAAPVEHWTYSSCLHGSSRVLSCCTEDVPWLQKASCQSRGAMFLQSTMLCSADLPAAGETILPVCDPPINTDHTEGIGRITP